MKKRMKKRKPCPYCGGKTVISKTLRSGYQEFKSDPDAYAYEVQCSCCAACGGWAKSESGAVRNWNMRPLEDALKEIIRHCWVYNGYRDCGFRQMTTEQKRLYERVIGRKR